MNMKKRKRVKAEERIKGCCTELRKKLRLTLSGRKEFKSALKAQLWCRGICCFIQDMVWGMKVVFCQVLHPQF